MSRFKIFLLILFLTCGILAAQQPTGKIIGKVTDDTGTGLPGVAVSAESPRMVGGAATITDTEGTFRLFSLPSGTYTLTFALDGFNTLVREGVFLQLEQTITINLQMTVQTLEESVTVIGLSPIIDVRSTVKGKTITREIFMSLPKGRDFTGLIGIIPGVQYEGNTGGLSVDGATGTENMWYVDGTNTTNMHIGTQAQSAVFELVDEVQVKASGYSAEFGGSMGGVVNVITRSGGNAFHGEVVGYYENNSKLMEGPARDYLRLDPFDDYKVEYVNNDDILYGGNSDSINDSRDPYYRMEGIFSLGGYILRDKLWFFGSFNPVYQKNTWARHFLPDDGTRTDFYRHQWDLNGQIKLTAQPVGGLRVSASFVNNYHQYRGSAPSIYGTSSSTYEWGKEGFDYPNYSANLTTDYTVGNNLLISARGGFFFTNQTNQQIVLPETRYIFQYSNISALWPEIPASLQRYRGWSNWAGSDYDMQKNIRERIIANFDMTYYAYLAGEHAFKFGVQYTRLHEDMSRALPHPRVYLYPGQTYNGLASGIPVNGQYGYYQIRGSFSSEYGWLWNIRSDNWAIYLQDSWTIGDKLTIQAGLRTESEYIPSFADPVLAPELAAAKPIQFDFKDKIAPRLGIIYDVLGDSSLKVFANYAIYYDVMKLYMAEGAFGGFKWISDYYAWDNYDWTQIAASGLIDDAASQKAGNTYVGTMNWRLPSFDTTNPDMKPTAQREITIGAEKKLTEDLAVSFRFVQKHLIRTIEDIGVLTPQGEQYYNDNPGFGWSLPISQGGYFDDKYWPTPKATREYYGLNFSLEKRFSNNWQGGVNYTWSRVAGNYSGLSSSDEGGRNSPNVERNFDLWFLAYDLKGNVLNGPLAHDRTHYVKVYGSYAFPFGLTVGFVGFGRSGQPLTHGLSLNNVNVYPNNRADLGRLPFTAWANLYMEYNLKLGGTIVNINLNIDNVTNTKAWQAQDTTPNRSTTRATDDEILSKSFDWQSQLASHNPDPAFGKFTSQFGTWSARLGFRFTF
ncbi:MAG: TonB-dependent receptor [Acidobacteria bacterium]|nr:TonB-dependent receptor [Acidobacteriota bacterium]